VYNEIVPAPLARVFDDEAFAGPRGPDGRHEIVVPRAWLDGRSWIEVPLPRLLSCASCDGGGCDGCDRSGAVATRPRKTPAEVVEVQLPGQSPAVLRLPRYGGLPADHQEGLDRGLLLLVIRAGDQPSEGLRLLSPPAAAPAPLAPPALISPSTLLWVAGAIFALALLWLISHG